MYGLNPDTIERLIAMYNAGRSIEYLAKFFHRDPAHIRHIISVYSED